MPSRRSLSLALIAALAAACSTPTPRTEPEPERVIIVREDGTPIRQLTGDEVQRIHYPATFDATWRAVQTAYADLGIPYTMYDRAAGKFGNGGFAMPRTFNDKPIRLYFECGSNMTGLLVNQGRVIATIMSTLTAAPGGGTDVSTYVTGLVQKSEGSSSGSSICASTGQLEQALRTRIQASLAAREPSGASQ